MPVRLPVVSGSLLSASVKAGLGIQKVLFVGQKTASGTATAGALNENILNDNSWDPLFGETSMLAAMMRAARLVNAATWFDAIALDDAAGTAATGTVAFTGAATAAGTLYVSVGSKTNHKYTVSIASGDSATAVGTALVTAIGADTKSPVTAVNTTGSVALTAVNLGTYGNTLGIFVEGSVAGITAAVTGMTGGATDPTLTTVFDVIGTNRYQGIVWPYTGDYSALTTLLDARFNVTNNILDGVGFASTTDTVANHLTALNALNSPSLCINADKLISTLAYVGPAVPEIPVVKAAQFASIRALRLTPDASIGSFVVTRSALDAYGGPALASKPYFNTPFPNISLVSTGNSWTDTEVSELKTAGGWIMDNNSAGNTVIAGEVVTTYKTDSAGNADPTFTYLNYVDTASAYREYQVNNFRSRYAQFRLTSGALVRGRDSANANSLATSAAEFNADLGSSDYALAQTGIGEINGVSYDFDKLYRDGVTVTIDMAAGQATIEMTAYIITQLRILLVPIQIAFSPGG